MDDIDFQDSSGNSALIWAAQRKDTMAVRRLLDAGANPNFQNSMGHSALHFASRYCTLSCVRLLLGAGSNPRSVNCSDFNVLHCHSEQTLRSPAEEKAVISCLVAAGVDVNGREKSGGATPLATAARYNFHVTAEALLDNGADLNARDNEGDSPLGEALLFNSEEVIRLLLSRGAHYASWLSNGNSLFHEVALSGSLNTIDILLEARLKVVDPDAKNREGHTALDLAQQREKKPNGFVQKLRLLLADVRSRNARIALRIDKDTTELAVEDVGALRSHSIRNLEIVQERGRHDSKRFQRIRILPAALETSKIAAMRTIVAVLYFTGLTMWIYWICRLPWTASVLKMVWKLGWPEDFEI